MTTCDEVMAVLGRFAPSGRVPMPPMSLRDIDTGLGYNERGLSLIAAPLNAIIFRKGGQMGVTGAQVQKCKVVSEVCTLVESKIPVVEVAGRAPKEMKPKAPPKARKKKAPTVKRKTVNTAVVRKKKKPRKAGKGGGQ